MNTAFENVKALCEKAKSSAAVLANSSKKKNIALVALAEKLIQSTNKILAANALDIENAKASGITDAMIDRLTLTPARIEAISKSVMKVVNLTDPTGSGSVKTLPFPLGLSALYMRHVQT